MSEWDFNEMGSSSSAENIEKLFEKSDYLSDTSRNSGLLVTVPELVRDIAPMRYGLLVENFYKQGTKLETSQSIENDEQTVPSSLSKLFDVDDDEIGHMDYQCKSFYMNDKFFMPREFSKSGGNGNSYTLHSKLFDEKEGVFGCHSKMMENEKVPIWEPTRNFFYDMEKECARNDSICSGSEAHRINFSPVLEKDPFSNRKNCISTVSSASRRIAKASMIFNRFRYQRIPRATVRRYLMDRDPKYKTKYG